ncbi:hypothetical protein AAE478_000105 [Parahypoxylon ruwenzoriense]
MGKNDGTPVNLLALDGGGIRGICELRVLDEIMRRVQKEQGLAKLPRPCDYFHLMAGTSTGGLVAILLSRFRMTTKEAIDAYYDFSGRIFSKKNKKGLIGHSFGEEILEKIIKEMVDAYGVGELMLDAEPTAQSKAFVCTQPAYRQGRPVRFRTYEPPPTRRDTLEVPSPSGSSTSRSPSTSSSPSAPSPPPSSSSSSSVDASRPTSPSPKSNQTSTTLAASDPWNGYRDIKIWEAARATTAAPSYFKKIVLRRGDSTEAFVDGAMGSNNPASELVDEATALFGPDCVLGCLISLGTGSSGPVTIGSGKGLKSLVDLIVNVKKLATDTESVHRGLQDQMRSELDAYFRFNLPSGAEKIGLHEYQKLDLLSQLMKSYIEQESSQIDKIVQILIGNAKPRGLTLGHIVRSDHGQICPPKKVVRGRPPVSDFFTGRRDVLFRLAEALSPDPQQPNRKRHHLLYGQPGTGKSQTASKFIDDYIDRFDVILWVDASSKETLEAGFKDQDFSAYGYVGDGSPKSLLRWLETTDRSWILVLDDARGNVSDYVPGGNKGAVLFTSQNINMEPRLHTRSTTMLDVMSEEEAVEFLISRARLDETDEAQCRQAVDLAETLGYLPLALEQSVATLRMKQYGISEYAKMLEDHRNNLLKKSGTENIPAVFQAVYASFEVAYKAINTQAHDPEDEGAEAAKYAVQLLSLFSFYHNEGLMGGIIARAFKNRPSRRRQDDFGIGPQSFADLFAADEKSGEWIKDRWRMGINLLIEYSLVKLDQSKMYYSIHGLLHDWARERTPDYIRRVQAKAARLVIFDSIGDQSKDHKDLLYHIKVLPHVQAVMVNTEDIDMNSRFEEAIHYHRFGMLLDLSSRPMEALFCFKKAYVTWIIDYAPTALRALRICMSVADASQSQGNYYVAWNMLMEVYDLSVQSRGQHDLLTLYVMVDLASLAIKLGKYEKGEKILRDAISFLKKMYPDEETITSTTELAIALFHLDRLDEARDILTQVVDETVKLVGYDHPFFFKATNNLAVVKTRLGYYEEAEKMILNVMEREKELFGHYYSGRPISLHNLATICFCRGNFVEAEEVFRDARALSECIGELAYLRPIYHVQGMSLAMYHQGRRQEAINLGDWCYDTFEILLKKDHPVMKMARRQMRAWLDEEDRGLPIQTETIAQIRPLFRT